MISKCGRSQEDPSHSNGIPLPMEALSKASFSMKRFRNTEHRVPITSVAQERGTTTPSLQTRAPCSELRNGLS